MRIKGNYWLVAAAAGVVLLGSGLAVASSPPARQAVVATFVNIFSPGSDGATNEELDAAVVVDVPEKVIADEKPDPIIGGKKQVDTSDSSAAITLPPNQVPWGQGPSDQEVPPEEQLLWYKGPSQ